MIAPSVSVDTKNLKRRLDRINKKLDTDTKLTVQDIGRWTRDNIIINMPKNTRASAQSITYRIEKMTTNNKEVVVTQRFQPHPFREWNGQWFNIPKWMFDSPKAIGHHWRNGSIMTMRAIPGMAEVKFRQRIQTDLDNISKI
jgi:hypothetical protein